MITKILFVLFILFVSFLMILVFCLCKISSENAIDDEERLAQINAINTYNKRKSKR